MRALVSHPEAPGHAVRGIGASVSKTRQGVLAISYSIAGDLGRVRIPPATAPRRAERLWQHTCCELFVARKERPGYHELNFSPSGEWGIYAFSRYRERVPFEDEPLSPQISVRSTPEKLELDALVRLDAAGPLRIGLSVVIEERSGLLSYWALRHAPGKPDFHHPDAFALELE